MELEPPRTPERPPTPRAADPRELERMRARVRELDCDGVEFERFASSGKRHKTCTTCKADRALRKAASALRLLVNPPKS